MISGFRFKDNYDWFNKRINSEVEYFSRENKWWEGEFWTTKEYYDFISNEKAIERSLKVIENIIKFSDKMLLGGRN